MLGVLHILLLVFGSIIIPILDIFKNTKAQDS